MPRRGLRMPVGDDSDSEELQTDLKYGGPSWKKERMVDTSKENDTDSEVSLDEDAESDEEKNLASDGDSDAPPESVAFACSRESALKTVRDAMQQVQAEQKRRKEKRQRLHTKYTEQKKRRLQALSEAQLPDDVLAQISSTPPPPQHSTAASIMDTPDGKSCDESNPDESTDDEIEISEEFIPVQYDRRGGLDIATEKDIASKTKSLAESAAEFRHKALYGNRIVRETTKSRLLRNKKKKARFE